MMSKLWTLKWTSIHVVANRKYIKHKANTKTKSG